MKKGIPSYNQILNTRNKELTDNKRKSELKPSISTMTKLATSTAKNVVGLNITDQLNSTISTEIASSSTLQLTTLTIGTTNLIPTTSGKKYSVCKQLGFGKSR